ncbi:enoyl-CoA hydratase/isomerase family protein [Pseudomaricurvus alkylphenolicus]|uniref:enoyl-CoA hydratase/isomerase family protein n=1 Tax=Pseudomaricurvus alkylphenolicus TaxID=1306991 RepID=UPI00141F38FB|nr:enoyl-CoA hydratase/isomerase family protein [Pseudomaricurvus alkylphenolicus]NIB43467.1 enoyl-CoA hydratase/isomerase family protein [Pseudomaricurvus alkylphenolicus]
MNIEHYRETFSSLCFETPSDGVLEVIFDTGTSMNPMNASMHRETAYVWNDIDRDKSVRSVLVRGAGKGFCAGGDFELVNTMIDSDEALLSVWKEGKDLVYNMINCSKPVVSAIHGAAVGAGLAVALLADISVAARRAKLIDSHTKLGVAAGDFAAIIWPILCGMAKAKYHLLTGRPIDGQEAERLGLVSLCVDEEDLYETALEIAVELSASSPSAVRWTKHALNNWLRMMGPTFDNSLALEMLGFRLPDIKEGLSATKDKRAANFDPDCVL